MPPARILLRAGAGFLLLVLLALLLTEVTATRNENLERREQPPAVRYTDGNTHYAGLVRERSLVLGRERSHWLYTGSDPGMGYGHFVRLDLTGVRAEFEDVRWTREGVRVRFTSGHEIFVPARYFTGGR